MAQKLWEKSVQVNKDIERFTVGRDREMDLYLAKHDVLGSMAHITMLESIAAIAGRIEENLCDGRVWRICDRRGSGRRSLTSGTYVDAQLG